VHVHVHGNARGDGWYTRRGGTAGNGMAVTYAHAAAALAALVDRALGGKEGTPARVAMAAAIGRRYWVLG